MKKLAAIVVGLLAVGALTVGLVAVIVDDRDALSEGTARLVVPTDARARIDGPGSRRVVGPGTYELETGDRVEAVAATSRIELGGAGVLQVRQGFRGSDTLTPENTVVRIDGVPTLLEGELLVLPHTEPIDLASAGTLVRVAGAARISRSLSLAVGVYDAHVSLESAGRSVDVAAYRQVAIADVGLVPGRPVPYVYDERDPWDQRFLGDAIDLTRELDAKATGFTAQVRPVSTGSDLFLQLFAELADEDAYIAGEPCALIDAGECLVGLAIALDGDDGTYAERQGEVFAFRRQGAAWGLVAADQGVGRTVLERIDAALDPGLLLFAAGGANSAEIPRSGPEIPPASGDDGGQEPASTTTTTTDPPSASPTTTTTEPPDSPIPTLPPPLEETIDPIVDIIGDLLPSEPSDTPSPLDPSPVEEGTDLTGELEGALREEQITDGALNLLG